MGMVFKNKEDEAQKIMLETYFDLSSIGENIDYEDLKVKIMELDIDSKEKDNIISKINKLNKSISEIEKDKLKEEINLFKNSYNI